MSHVTNEWVMSHVNEPCHVNEWAMSHIPHMNASRQKKEWVMSHMQKIELFRWVVGFFWYEVHCRSLSGSCLPYLRQKKKKINAKIRADKTNGAGENEPFLALCLCFFMSGEKIWRRCTYGWVEWLLWDHATHKWVMSHMHESWNTCMRHVAHEECHVTRKRS